MLETSLYIFEFLRLISDKMSVYSWSVKSSKKTFVYLSLPIYFNEFFESIVQPVSSNISLEQAFFNCDSCICFLY